jgi:3-isopropylmalate/(R)-2-methylmalate dehydratase large subunit
MPSWCASTRGILDEYTTAQVHAFLAEEYGIDYRLADPTNFAVFEDHLIYAAGVPAMAPFSDKIEKLREMQREFQEHTGVPRLLGEGLE